MGLFSRGKKDPVAPPRVDELARAIAYHERTKHDYSCQQDIAADGCFSLGMVADFRAALMRFGPWFYRRLFWECGFVGQLLYLEAEALGLRATGIGCFFDDPVHQALGLSGTQFQSLYHFTLGAPVDDSRITAEAAYRSAS